MRFLVTGATGFIGSHLCKELLNQGHQVKAFHRPESPLELLQGLPVEHVQGNLADQESLNKALKDVQVLFHTAAHLGKRDPRLAYETTVLGTRHLVNAALNTGVERFVHTSSVAALGIPFEQRSNGRYHPQLMNENHSWNYTPTGWPYGYYKHLAELEVQAAVAKGLDAVIVNPALVIGARDINRIAGDIIIRVAKRRLPITIDGGLNLVHISDVVNGHIAAFQSGQSGERYILANENVTHTQFFQMIAEAAGVKPPIIKVPSVIFHTLARPLSAAVRLSGIPIRSSIFDRVGFYFFFDNTKAKSKLNLAGFISARQAIIESLDWYRSRSTLNI